jgi:antitoxin YefM
MFSGILETSKCSKQDRVQIIAEALRTRRQKVYFFDAKVRVGRVHDIASSVIDLAAGRRRIGHNSDQDPRGEDDMKTMPLSEVKTKLSELVAAVERRDEVVTITRNGKPVAIIVSKDEYECWQETVEIMRDAKFMKEIRKGIQSLKRTKKRYSLDELFTD